MTTNMTRLVAPLVWANDNWHSRIRAKTTVGDYLIWWGYNGEKHSLRFADHAVTEHENTVAAQAAAQADCAARIIAALDPDALAAMLSEAEQRGREAEQG